MKGRIFELEESLATQAALKAAAISPDAKTYAMLIGVSESVTMAAINPAWAPLVAFSILIALLLWKPKWL